MRTPLFEEHCSLGAHIVDFAGFEMPVRYTSDLKEHGAVRTGIGIFDVSHMGEIVLQGAHAQKEADRLVTNNISNLKNFHAAYALMLNEQGGIVDDVIVYKFNPEKILICVNASNTNKDYEWIKAHSSIASNQSAQWAQIAVQGPKACELVRHMYGDEAYKLARFSFMEKDDSIIARTGYTGEDGYEIYLPPHEAVKAWRSMLACTEFEPVMPCGLGARDTLRLEAGMCLYGNDINEENTPLEAGLGFAVKFNKEIPFIGQQALMKQKEQGVTKKLVGIKLSDKNIARHNYPIFNSDSQNVGIITSGTLSPTLGYPIAMAYVQTAYAEKGTKVFVEIRGKKAEAKVCALPFYKRNHVEKNL